ncbi:hypothetical protein NDU88_008898 [Pleurodeles waltl]|uniref:Uncharacterized protein n=1 Tax=Pleurodeles waltl TaxID=8319 RepID=A0AAV7PTF3_PLEWA|nr:hypothetical protein NDU88_008898 [Pleurodeles waltl]
MLQPCRWQMDPQVCWLGLGAERGVAIAGDCERMTQTLPNGVAHVECPGITGSQATCEACTGARWPGDTTGAEMARPTPEEGSAGLEDCGPGTGGLT